MITTFSDTQVIELKKIWRQHGGKERLEGDFISELSFFMENTPELITGSRKKIETYERDKYLGIEKQCAGLIKALSGMPALDRLNILSLREQREEYGGRSVPIIDPYSYVKGIQKRAGSQAGQLNITKKHTRQLYGLMRVINGFPILRGLNKRQFIELFRTLYEGAAKGDFYSVIEDVIKKEIGGFKKLKEYPQREG